MSLVSEALRKARQEAAQREGRDRGIPRGLVVPPKRWRSAPGLLLAILIALAAAVAGAAVAWWTLSRRAATETSSAALDRPASATPAPAVAPIAATTPSGAASQGDRAPVAAHSGPAPAATDQVQLPGAASGLQPHAASTLAAPAPEPQPVSGAGQPAPDATAERPGTHPGPAESAPRERVFVVDADLGYAKLHLDYVVYRPSSPFAGINGQQVVIGSVIEGFQVEEIGPELVRLRDGRGTVVLRTH